MKAGRDPRDWAVGTVSPLIGCGQSGPAAPLLGMSLSGHAQVVTLCSASFCENLFPLFIVVSYVSVFSESDRCLVFLVNTAGDLVFPLRNCEELILQLVVECDELEDSTCSTFAGEYCRPVGVHVECLFDCLFV